MAPAGGVRRLRRGHAIFCIPLRADNAAQALKRHEPDRAGAPISFKHAWWRYAVDATNVRMAARLNYQSVGRGSRMTISQSDLALTLRQQTADLLLMFALPASSPAEPARTRPPQRRSPCRARSRLRVEKALAGGGAGIDRLPGCPRARASALKRERDGTAGTGDDALLPKLLRMFSYARGGGVSRAAKGADCKSAGYAFVGSSPTSPTMARHAGRRGMRVRLPTSRGCSSMVEQQPSKLMTRVRFPSPAPTFSMA